MGSSTNLTTCDAIQSSLHARPTPSPSFRAANLAGFCLGVSFVIVGTTGWFYFRHLHRLAAQSKVSSLLASLGALMFLIGGAPLRNSGAIADGQGYPRMSCAFAGVAYVVGVSALSLALYIRLWTTAAREQYTRLARTYHEKLGDGDPGGQKQDQRVPPMRSRISPCPLRLPVVYEVDADCEGEGEDTLRRLREATSSRTYFMLSVTPAAACLVVACALVELSPAMREGCTGCEPSWDVAIAVALLVGAYALAVAPILRTLHSVGKNPLKLRAEFRQAVIVVFALTPVALVVTAADPGRLSWSFVVAWEWLLNALGLALWFLWVPWEAVQALAEARTARARKTTKLSPRRTRVAAAQAFITREMLVAHLDDEDFMAFADSCYSSESVRFLQDVLTWKRFYGDKGFAWARLKAHGLVHMYVEPGSPLEINVSHAARTKSLDDVAKHDIVPYEAFDPAASEVLHLLLVGPFRMFVLSRVRQGKAIRPARAAATGLDSFSRKDQFHSSARPTSI